MPRATQSKAAAKKSSSKAGKAGKGGASRSPGRPVEKIFINVLVKASTRKSLNELKAITGLKTQGEILDILVAQAMKLRP